ncbi:MAG: hypothetical protein NT076_05050 [Candidatus Pacearchaeota archaeon]|nr:hypothetical protein [Candidatus Pacearchaeota archaeon]
MIGLNEKELAILKKLDSPRKIQDFLDGLRINFEEKGDTCLSPRVVLKSGKAHCIEAAILACLALRLNGWKSWLVDLKASRKDYDHVIAVFKQFGKYGAVSKSNHSVLRYREPVYSSVKELVMGYFNEYCNKGRKTLRSFSVPVNIARFDKLDWISREENVWEIADYLDKVKHFSILDRKQIANLRKQDLIEERSQGVVEWTKDGKTFWVEDGTRKVKLKDGEISFVD